MFVRFPGVKTPGSVLKSLRDKSAGPGALWALAFGDGEKNSDPLNQPANALYFTAGPNFPNGGLLGTLTPVQADLTQGSDQ